MADRGVWIQPTHAGDAYDLGDTVTHIGRRWESLIVGNDTVPGSDPRWWEDLGPDTPPPTAREVAVEALARARAAEQDLATVDARAALDAFWVYPGGDPAPSEMLDVAHVDVPNALVVFADPTVAVAVQRVRGTWTVRRVRQDNDGTWTHTSGPLVDLADLGRVI